MPATKFIELECNHCSESEQFVCQTIKEMHWLIDKKKLNWTIHTVDLVYCCSECQEKNISLVVEKMAEKFL